MKEEKIFDAMADIDKKYILEARTNTVDKEENVDKKRNLGKKKLVWAKWSTMAACLCFVLVVGYYFSNSTSDNNTKDINNHTKDINNHTDNTDVLDEEDYLAEQTKKAEVATDGIKIPAIELPDSTTDEKTDMLGLVVYKGNIYTQAESYLGDDAVAIDYLTGRYLGYATGSIDEYSSKEEYSNEFASSVEGKVYEVDGYDTDFRVCIRKEIEDENGKKQLWIQYFNHLNAITFATGSDLFDDRLHLTDKITDIQWQSHDDWDNGKDNLQTATINTNTWKKFLDEVNKAKFVNTMDKKSLKNSIYDTQKQAHIILTLKDGTCIRLRLIEGGYVGYEELGWYFVQIPEDIFDPVFSACGGKK